MGKKKPNPANVSPQEPRTREHLKGPFLEAMKSRIFITQAAEAVGIDRSTVYDWRDKDLDFKKKMDDVEARSLDILRAEAFRRAVVGVEEPTTVAGRAVTVRRYSDYLLDRMLRAKDPAFKDQLRVDVHVNFVNMLVVKLQEIVQRVIPIKCPHCNTLLAMRKDMARELVALSNAGQEEMAG